jgi:hypothetical protein
MDPVPVPPLLRKSGSTEIRTRTSGAVARHSTCRTPIKTACLVLEEAPGAYANPNLPKEVTNLVSSLSSSLIATFQYTFSTSAIYFP